MVTHSDAIIDPRAVMVEALDAVAADGTMAAATRSYCLAVGAELGAVDVLQHVKEVDVVVAQVARLRTCGLQKEEGTKHSDS